MYLTKLEVTDFQGIKRIVLEPAPLTLVCGQNWSGKTSLQQAVRLALTGDVARVDLKGDYKLLIRDGAKKARVKATWKDEDWNAEITHSANTIPTAEAMPPALLDQHRLARLPVDDRRRELLHILKAGASPEIVRQKLTTAGVAPAMIDDVLPVLEAGFEAMARLAEGWATESRGAWRQVTGEAYGDNKGETWAAPVDQLSAAEKTALIQAKKRAELVTQAQAQLSEFEPIVMGMREELRRAGAQLTCPHCGAIYDAIAPERVSEIRMSLPEHEKSLTVLRNALDNRKRDLAQVGEAQQKLDQAEKLSNNRTDMAQAAHKNVQAWKKLRDLLSPGGIPAEILQDALAPVNELLREMGAHGWGQVMIGPACQIHKDGRLYGLLSEAEQWLTDAMLLIALCAVTDNRFLMLDRLDVLDARKRGMFVQWLKTLLAVDFQVLLFATLKQKPELGLNTMSVWLTDGEVLEEATA